MASDFGLKLGIEGEKEFKKSLSEINSSFKVLASEMTLVTSQYDKNDKSAQALTSRNNVLNKEIDSQKDKISLLEQALKNSSESFGENDKRTEAWATKLNLAKADLNKMEGELNENNKTLNENSEGLGDSKKSLDEFAEGEKEAGKQALTFGDLVKANLISEAIIGGIKALGSAISSVGSYLKDSIASSAAYGDNILAMSAQTGVSTKSLQEYSAIAELVDTDLETMTKSMAKNIKSMTGASGGTGAASEAYKKLGVSVTDANGNLRDSEQVYWETIDALGKVTNETERDSLAMQILGKSAQDLNPLIAQGSAGIAELTANAYEMGAVLSEDALNSLGAMDDSMQIWKGTLSSTANLLGATFAPAITEIISGANGVVGAFNGMIASVLNGGDTGAAASKFADMVGSMVSRISEAIPKLLETGKTLITTLLQGISAALPALVSAASTLIPEIIGAVVSVLPSLTGTAITIVMTLVTALINALPQLVDAAVQVVTMLVSGISQSLPILIPAIVSAVLLIAKTLIDNVDLILQAGIDLLMGLVLSIPEIIKVLVPMIPEIITSIINALVENIPILYGAAIELFMALVQAIPEIVVVLVQNLPQIVMAILNGLAQLPTLIWNILTEVIGKFFSWGEDSQDAGNQGSTGFLTTVIDVIKTLPAKVWEWLVNTFNKISEFFQNIVSTAINKSKEFLDAIINKVKNLPGDVWNSIIGAVSKVAEWGSNLVAKGREAAQNLWNSIVDGIKNLPSEIFNIGKNLVQGLWNGINDMVGWIKSKIQGFGNAVMSAIKGIFGIASPSKLMRDQVGKNLALGLGEGFVDMMGKVEKDIQNALPTDFDLGVNASIDDSLNGVVGIPQIGLSGPYFVESLKEALAGMSILIDGDKVGQLVTNQVEKVVFA